MSDKGLNNEAIKELLRVITNRKEGYEKASQYVEDDELSELFESYVKQSEDFAMELAPYNDYLQKDLLDSDVTNTRKLREDMKLALTTGDKKEILDSCIAGEEAALGKYTEIIEELNLPEELYNVIDQQRDKIEEAYESIKIQINSI